MAIIANRNLLGCDTLRDWAVVRSELPYILEDEPGVDPRRRDALIYFALQGAAPFHICAVLCQERILLLHGAAELRTLTDFMFCGAPVERERWRFPLPLPGDKPCLTASDFSPGERERVLTVRIPHCDFTVDSQEDLEALRAYYTSFTSSEIC